MSRYRLSARARGDLDDIWLSIAPDNIPAADRMIDRLVDRFRMIATQPGLGRLRPELAEQLRSVPVGNYLVFYRFRTDGVDIVRVLHGSRDMMAFRLGGDPPEPTNSP